MEIETINLEGKQTFQVSWNGSVIRGASMEEVSERLRAFQHLTDWAEGQGVGKREKRHA